MKPQNQKRGKIAKWIVTALTVMLIMLSGIALPVFRNSAEVYAAGTAESPVQVSDWDELCAAVAEGGYVQVTKDIVPAPSSSISVTKDVTIVGPKDGSATIYRGLKDGDNKYGALLRVESGKLTLGENLIFSGHRTADNKDWFGNVAFNAETRGFFVHVTEQGSLIINGATFRDYVGNKAIGVSPIFVAGDFTMNSGQIVHNWANAVERRKYTNFYGLDAAAQGSNSLHWDNGSNAKLNGEPHMTNNGGDRTAAETVAGGIVIDAPGKTVYLNGGEIRANAGHAGGVAVLGGTLVINGGTIGGTSSDMDKDNETNGNWGDHFGGGLFVNTVDAEVRMCGGSIRHNLGAMGGGVLVANQAKFFMMGGEIDHNTSAATGGGILVYSDNVYLLKGRITNNAAPAFGGGVYVYGQDTDINYQYTLTMHNAEITNNHAVNDNGNNGPFFIPNAVGEKGTDAFRRGSGGGVWLCPAGTTEFNASTLNIYDNDAANQGKDFHKDAGFEGGILLDFGPHDELAPNADSKGDWIHDEENGIKTGQPLTVDEATSGDKGVISVENVGKKKHVENPKLIFEGNVSNRGGAIGSDGSVFFIEPSDEDKNIDQGSLNFEKTFVNMDKKSMEYEMVIADENDQPILNERGEEVVVGYWRLYDANYKNSYETYRTTPGYPEFGQFASNWSEDLSKINFAFPQGMGEVHVFEADNPKLNVIIREYEVKASDDASMKSLAARRGAKVSERIFRYEISDQYKEEVRLEKEITVYDGPTGCGDDLQGCDCNPGKPQTFTLRYRSFHFDATAKNEDYAEIEKYVSQAVHDDIALDEVFDYDILAYIPQNADEVVITDALSKDLAFAPTNGNVSVYDLGTTTDDAGNQANIESNHLPVYDVSGKEINHDGETPSVKTGTALDAGTYEVSTDKNALTVKIVNTIDDEGKPVDGQPQNVTPLRGHYIRVHFQAQISEEMQAKILAGEKTLADLTNQKIEDDKKEDRSEPNVGNDPVISDENHEGIPNKAEYTVKVGNEAEARYKDSSNTVTVKPELVDLEVKKAWEPAAWPEDVKKIVFTVYVKDGSTETPLKVNGKEVTVELTKDKTSATIKNLPKLETLQYVIRETAIDGKEVSYNSDKTVGMTEGLAIIGVTDAKDNVFTTTNSQPAIEKYVNDKVHADIEFFNAEFEYDIMAYVPAGSTKVILSDELKPQLELVSGKAEIEASAVSKDENNHTVEGSVSETGTSIAATALVDGNKVDVTIENENGKLDGKWVQVTLKAKISEGAYNKIAEKLSSDDPDAADEEINWAKIEKDDPVIVGNPKLPAEAPSHSGLVNKASYKVYVDEEGSSDYESNEVTVKPETEKVYVQKKIKNANGTEVAKWPEGLELSLKVTRTLDGESEVVDSIKVNSLEKFASKELPKLKGATYSVDEVTVPAGYDKVSTGGKGTEDEPLFVVNKDKEPTVEKYINQDVHASLEEFDKAFTYDILAYVTRDADKIVITDELVNSLEFSKTGKGEKGIASVKPEEVVVRVAVKDDNDHTPNGTVATDGTALDKDAYKAVIDGKKLTITIGGDEDDEKITDEDGLRGKWIQVTFYAKYTKEAIEAAKVADATNVTDNGTVISDKEHEGTVNKATLEITPGNGSSYECTSNEVTHDAETEKVYVEKVVLEPNGSAMTVWPEGLEVKIAVTRTIEGEEPVVVDTITVDSLGKKASVELPKLMGATYSADEVEVPAGYVKTKVDGAGTEADPFKVYNKSDDTPGLEKYINQDVHTSLEDFDKAFTYDILAYVTYDADKVVITDTLVPSLEFSKTGEGTKGEASSNPAEVVVGVEVKDDNDHTANGTVAKAGKPLAEDKYEAVISGQTLTLTIGGDEDDKKITDEDGLRGKWVQVTFYAKYTQEAIDAALVADAQNVTDNMSIITSYDEHAGTTNMATCKISVDNKAKYETFSNTVTHDAETEQIWVQKVLADDEEVTVWPEGLEVKIAVKRTIDGKTEELEVITVDSLAKKASKVYPKLMGATYSADEVEVPAGYEKESVAGTGAKDDPFVITNRFLRTDVDATKTWKNVTMDEIPSAEDFKSFLLLYNSAGEDVTERYANNLTVTERGTTYYAKWARLPMDEYTVSEKEHADFTSAISGNSITNTKKPENEEPEIEKFVNEAVHKDITLDEVFTYDIVAYVTRDADSVTITDTLNDVLTFAGSASDVKVVDLGEANNHLVTNSIENVKVNDNATVAEAGTPIEDAVVEIEGKTLTVSITNNLEPVFAKDAEEEDGKEENGEENSDKEESDEKTSDEEDADKKDDTKASEEDAADAEGKAGADEESVEKTEESADDSSAEDGEQADAENGEKTEDVAEENATEETPDAADAEKDDTNEAVFKENENDPAATDENKMPETATSGNRGDAEIIGYKYVGDKQPVTALRGHWIKVTFTARIDGRTLSEVKKAYENIDKNDPVISVEEHFGVPNDASYSIGVANEHGIQGNVYNDSSNTVTVKPDVEYPVYISKNELGGSEIEGAEIVVKNEKGEVIDEWTSTTESHKLELKPGKYSMKEVVAPEGYKQVTTEIWFEVDDDGKVTLLTTEVNGGGQVSVNGTDHIILEDAPDIEEVKGETIDIPVTKIWDDMDDRDKLRPAQITVHLYADGTDTGKTLTLTKAGGWTGKFTEMPKYTEAGVEIVYSVVEDAVKGYAASYEGDAASGLLVFNTHEPKSEIPEKPEEPKKDEGVKPSYEEPTKPTPPTTPTTPTSGTTQKKSVKTGDDFNAALWFALLGAAAVGVLVAARRKRRKDNETAE